MMTSYMNASFLSSYPRALKLMRSPVLKMACVSVALACPVLQRPVQGYCWNPLQLRAHPDFLLSEH